MTNRRGGGKWIAGSLPFSPGNPPPFTDAEMTWFDALRKVGRHTEAAEAVVRAMLCHAFPEAVSVTVKAIPVKGRLQ